MSERTDPHPEYGVEIQCIGVDNKQHRCCVSSVLAICGVAIKRKHYALKITRNLVAMHVLFRGN